MLAALKLNSVFRRSPDGEGIKPWDHDQSGMHTNKLPITDGAEVQQHDPKAARLYCKKKNISKGNRETHRQNLA